MRNFCFIVCFMIILLTGCGQSSDIPSSERINIVVEDPENEPDSAINNSEGNEENYEQIIERGVFETGVEKDGYRQYLVTGHLYETEDWESFHQYPKESSIQYTVFLPTFYFLDSSIIMSEGTKVGELWSPVILGDGQSMPLSLDSIADTFKYGVEMIVPREFYNSEIISVNEETILFFREIIHPEGVDENITVWYPHTFYIARGNIVFHITFYPLVKYPEAEIIDMYKRVVLSIEIVEEEVILE